MIFNILHKKMKNNSTEVIPAANPKSNFYKIYNKEHISRLLTFFTGLISYSFCPNNSIEFNPKDIEEIFFEVLDIKDCRKEELIDGICESIKSFVSIKTKQNSLKHIEGQFSKDLNSILSISNDVDKAEKIRTLMNERFDLLTIKYGFNSFFTLMVLRENNGAIALYELPLEKLEGPITNVKNNNSNISFEINGTKYSFSNQAKLNITNKEEDIILLGKRFVKTQTIKERLKEIEEKGIEINKEDNENTFIIPFSYGNEIPISNSLNKWNDQKQSKNAISINTYKLTNDLLNFIGKDNFNLLIDGEEKKAKIDINKKCFHTLRKDDLGKVLFERLFKNNKKKIITLELLKKKKITGIKLIKVKDSKDVYTFEFINYPM